MLRGRHLKRKLAMDMLSQRQGDISVGMSRRQSGPCRETGKDLEASVSVS